MRRVTGKDLIAEGYEEGEALGQLLLQRRIEYMKKELRGKKE
jgi:hypothetical protein